MYNVHITHSQPAIQNAFRYTPLRLRYIIKYYNKKKKNGWAGWDTTLYNTCNTEHTEGMG